MTVIRIYRKESQFSPTKLSKADQKALMVRIDALSRVSRPNIVDFFLSGQFSKLPAMSSAIVNNPPLRRLDYLADGWIVPESDLGKSGSGSAQTLKLWIEKHLAPIVSLEELAIVLDPS